ncbi:methyl-accepting chemotaxis protein [Quadrisphaera granulorum]|uniref:Methyl-accepting chemotaxis protein n=1 Tax=Quadrisphaera granulorum TaxID=317664 RepID=A0A315ZYG9_9ACTN|nr:methyl-accepting chemotaxis protein [Quadrisphaera granulorum]PWJ49564.1 methyl-accepting chemotaxis protein [Quadrisphaera granulorum]SZE98143.1 methyl-accepting chemotaxis protein [Quadrisphaera granulorum]
MLRRLADLSIATKLYLAFGVVCSLLLVVTAVGAVRLQATQAALEEVSNHDMVAVDAASQTDVAFQGVRVSILNVALAPDAASTDAALTSLDTSWDGLDAAWSHYKDSTNATTPAQQKAFTDAMTTYRESVKELMPYAVSHDDEGFNTVRAKVVVPAAKAATAAVKELATIEKNASIANAAENEAAYRQALAVLFGCAAVAMLLAVAVAVVVARSVTRPLSRVVDVMAGVAQGRLDQRVGLDRRDEVGRLSASTDASLESMSSALRDIRAEAASLASDSASLSSVSAQMASGAEESAAQTMVVSAASEEVSASISTVAAAGEEMTAAIGQIASATSEASQMASSAVAAAGAAGGAIERLGVSSREIGDVVKLITSIAEQTNLLALNATIEAARAGELGKGFAVVAGEVKELARQTAQATDEIIKKVSATQGDAAAAASAVTQIGEVISRIDEVQATIAAAVEEQSATTSEMVRNVTEVSTGSSQISANVADIAAGTEQNRESAGHTAATASSLASSANRLQELTGRFTV